MGKSYKKNPVIKDNGNSKKKQKKLANHSIRSKLKNGTEIGGGSEYKKHYESYNITDYVCRWTKDEAIKHYIDIVEKNIEQYPGQKENFIKNYPTLEKWLNYWNKCVKRK